MLSYFVKSRASWTPLPHKRVYVKALLPENMHTMRDSRTEMMPNFGSASNQIQSLAVGACTDTVLYMMPLQRILFSLMNSVLKIIYTPSCHSRSTVICPVVGAAYLSPTALAVKSINTSIPWGTWTEVIRRSANRLKVNFTVSLDYLITPQSEACCTVGL